MQRGAWLDFLRFAVAGLIIIHHFHASGPVDLAETVHPVFERGFILTNFFLLDSGYVLARIYANRIGVRMTYGEFVRKRFLRLWPGHLVILGGLVAMYFLAELLGVSPTHARWFDWSQFPAQLFLVQSFGVPGGLGWNAPTWSISALLGCYLAFPLLIKLFWRIPPWTALALGVGIYLLADLLTHVFLGLPVYEMPMKYGFFRALPLFMMGVVLAGFSERVYIAPHRLRPRPRRLRSHRARPGHGPERPRHHGADRRDRRRGRRHPGEKAFQVHRVRRPGRLLDLHQQ
jgi:peptidoglycan/LPS O-acetylase OafA/YrhL